MGMSIPGNSCTPCTASLNTSGCLFKLGGECVSYSGTSTSGINTGDNLNIVIGKLLALISGGGSGSVTSVGLIMPSAFTVSNSPITSTGDLIVTGNGTISQYIRGDGSLATFPTQQEANNGLSTSGNNIQLGQTFGDPTNPSLILDTREIPLNGNVVLFTDTVGTGFVVTPSIRLTGQSIGNDFSISGLDNFGRLTTVPSVTYGQGINEFSFVTAQQDFFAYTGVLSWPYVTGDLGNQPLHGKFSNYVAGFSAGQLWDGSGGAGNNRLDNSIGHFSAIQCQSGSILNGYDVYASEINTVQGTTQNPPVTNHYAFFAEPFVYATNNYGVYINGSQTNYLGGKLGIGQTAPTSSLHIKAGSATAGTSPIKLTAGPVLTTPETGAIEYDGTHYYGTIGSTRFQLDQQSGGGGTPGGTTTNIQFNNAGSFGGSNNLVWDNTNTVLRTTAEVIGGAKSTIGTLIQDNFSRTTLGSNYVATLPNGTATLDGIKLNIAGGTGAFTNFLEYEEFFRSEQWTYSITATIGAVNSTSFGIVLGMFGGFPIFGRFGMDTGTNGGKAIIETTLGTPLATSTALTLTAGNVVILTLSRSHGVITATYNNTSTTTTVTTTYTYNYASDLIQNTSKPRVYLYGGSQSITALSLTEQGLRNISVLGIGDSIMQGFGTTLITNRYMNLVFSNDYTKFSVYAGPSDTIQNVQSAATETAAASAKHIVLAIGTNNITAGDTVAQFTTRYYSLLVQLMQMGALPIILSITPRNSADVTPYNAAIQSIALELGIQYIDIFTALKNGAGTGLNPIYDRGDGLHLNTAGHAVVAPLITSAVPTITTLDNSVNFTTNTLPSYINGSSLFGGQVSLNGGAFTNTAPAVDDSSTIVANTNWVQRVLTNNVNNFIVNGTAIQAGASFNVSGTGRVGGTFASVGLLTALAGITVGAGTTSIGANLSVVGPAQFNNGLTVAVGNTVLANSLQFDTNTGPRIADTSGNGIFYQSAKAGNQHNFINFGSTSTAVTVVFIGSNGVTSDVASNMLHVQGKSAVEGLIVKGTGNVLVKGTTDNGNALQVTGLSNFSTNIAVGAATATALLHLVPTGTTAAGTAPLKFTSGALMTTPENGAFEFDGTHLYFTIGSTRTILI